MFFADEIGHFIEVGITSGSIPLTLQCKMKLSFNRMNFFTRIGLPFSLFFVVLISSCSPEDGLDGSDGIDGRNGLNSLVDVAIEPIGSNCVTGGYLIQSGLDANSNNILDDSEVSSSEYLCNPDNFDSPFLTYVSLISQSGTASPTSLVLQNSAEIAISWSRVSQGIYVGQLSEAIDIAKTVIFYSTPSTHIAVRGSIIGSDQIRLELQAGVNFFADNFENLSFELRQYE